MAVYHYQNGDQPLDGYTIQYALGRGGFGEVYFAISDSGREVALKAVQNFEDIELRGIGHCMNLKSPHLVMIFDIKHAADGTPWVIMEYVSGPSLRDILDESPQGLGTDQSLFFLRELAKGLSYLHEAGVVHRDLKPHNVFFEDGIVKIGDYSLSKVITTSHRSGNTMTVGSVHYMAPEISLGRYDKTVDIYALGVMLYEMLTGQPPHVGESMGEVLMKHLSADPDLSQVPAPFADVIARAMHRDPQERFQTAQEMIEAASGATIPAEVDDSFNPATLSLVGERARKARASESASQVAVPQVVPPVARSTAPTAIQDTSQHAVAPLDAVAARPVGWLQKLGLHYSPPERVHAIPDGIWYLPRLLLAAMATLIIVTLGGAYSPLQLLGSSWYEVHLLTANQVVCCAVLTLAACRWLSFHRGVQSALISRAVWGVAGGIGIIATIIMLGPQGIVSRDPVLLAVMVALVIPDWRCLVAPDRTPRVASVATVVVGVVAVLAAMIFNNGPDFAAFAASIAMATAISVQLLAPLRRATIDAPLFPLSATNRSRLRYDRVAMIQELIVAATVVIVIGLIANGDDDETLVAFGIFAGLVGGLTLRFRLQRRVWPEQSTHPDQSNIDHDLPDVAGGRSLDILSVILELVIAGCVATVVGLSLDGDHDLFPVGVAVAVIGALALRYRLFRGRYLKGLVRSGESRLRFDPTSVVLELLTGASLVVTIASLFSGEDDLFPLAAAAAAVGVVVLRFRLSRTTDAALPASRQDGQIHQPNGQSEELQEIR